MHGLDRLFHTSRRCVWGQRGIHVVSLRTACPDAVRWDVLALQPDWAVLQAVYAPVAGDMLTPHQHLHWKRTPEFTKNVGYSFSTAS